MNLKSQNEFRLEAFCGANLGKMANFYTNRTNREVNTPITLGFDFGIAFEYSILKDWGLYSELGFLHQRRKSIVLDNSNFIFFTTSTTRQTTLFVNSLEIPFMCNYHFNFGKFSMKPMLGVIISVNVNGRSRIREAFVQKSDVVVGFDDSNVQIDENKLVFEKIPDNAGVNVIYHKRGNAKFGIGLKSEWNRFGSYLLFAYGLVNQYAVNESQESGYIPERYFTSDFTIRINYLLVKTK